MTFPFILNVTVFLTGAAVLVLEIIATRLLAPYFGNTIFSISSILSVVLAALSVGYLAGGKLADRNPSRKLFFTIIWISGAAVLLVRIISSFFLLHWFAPLGSIMGPLVASAFLFFAPSFLLGMLSPFAIRLKMDASRARGIGANTGEIFFYSTAGSIAGSLATGFILVPTIGVADIVSGTGIVLFALGLAGALGGSMRRMVLIIIVSAAAAFGLFRMGEMPLHANEIFAHDGLYERISVVDNAPNFSGKRTLFLDRSPSTSIFLSDASPNATIYAEYLALDGEVAPAPRRILVLGGGAYAVPRYARMLYPESFIDVVEIEPRLRDIAKDFFSLEDDERMTHYVADARAFLRQHDTAYDIIFVDVYSSFLSIPTHLTTEEFFELLRTRLAADGIVLMNVAGSLGDGLNGFLRAEARTFKSVFPGFVLFALQGPDVPGPQNFVFAAAKNDGDIGVAENMDAGGPFLNAIQKLRVPQERLSLDGAVLLTDDFAPVDYLIAPLVALY